MYFCIFFLYLYLPRKGWRRARNWVTEDVRGSAMSVHAHAPQQRVTCSSPPRGLQDHTPLPRNTFPSFCHQHGPRVVDGCIALLGERHLPIILSQALLAVEDAHLGRLQHKQTHWQVPQGLCRLAKENMW